MLTVTESSITLMEKQIGTREKSLMTNQKDIGNGNELKARLNAQDISILMNQKEKGQKGLTGTIRFKKSYANDDQMI